MSRNWAKQRAPGHHEANIAAADLTYEDFSSEVGPVKAEFLLAPWRFALLFGESCSTGS